MTVSDAPQGNKNSVTTTGQAGGYPARDSKAMGKQLPSPCQRRWLDIVAPIIFFLFVQTVFSADVKGEDLEQKGLSGGRKLFVIDEQALPGSGGVNVHKNGVLGNVPSTPSEESVDPKVQLRKIRRAVMRRRLRQRIRSRGRSHFTLEKPHLHEMPLSPPVDFSLDQDTDNDADSEAPDDGSSFDDGEKEDEFWSPSKKGEPVVKDLPDEIPGDFDGYDSPAYPMSGDDTGVDDISWPDTNSGSPAPPPQQVRSEPAVSFDPIVTVVSKGDKAKASTESPSAMTRTLSTASMDVVVKGTPISAPPQGKLPTIVGASTISEAEYRKILNRHSEQLAKSLDAHVKWQAAVHKITHKRHSPEGRNVLHINRENADANVSSRGSIFGGSSTEFFSSDYEDYSTDWSGGNDRDVLLDNADPGVSNERALLRQLAGVKQLFRTWGNAMPEYRKWRPHLLDARDMILRGATTIDIDPEATERRLHTLARMDLGGKYGEFQTGVKLLDKVLASIASCMSEAKEGKDEVLGYFEDAESNEYQAVAMGGSGVASRLNGLAFYTFSLFFNDQISLKNALLSARVRGWNGDPSDWTGVVQGRLTQIVWIMQNRVRRYEYIRDAVASNVDGSFDLPKVVIPNKLDLKFLKEKMKAVKMFESFLDPLDNLMKQAIEHTSSLSLTSEDMTIGGQKVRQTFDSFEASLKELARILAFREDCSRHNFSYEEVFMTFQDKAKMRANFSKGSLEELACSAVRQIVMRSILAEGRTYFGEKPPTDDVSDIDTFYTHRARYMNMFRSSIDFRQTIRNAIHQVKMLMSGLLEDCARSVERYRLGGIGALHKKLQDKLVTALDFIIDKYQKDVIPKIVKLLDAVCGTRLEPGAREIQTAGEYSLD